MATVDHTALIQRLFDEVWNGDNLALIDELFAPDYVRHGAPADLPPGPAGERQHRATFRAVFPDLVITADDIVAEGDRVAVRYHWHGTYHGGWPGIEGTGRVVTMTGIAIHRVVAGRIVELWVVGDELGLLQQLGALPSPLYAPALPTGPNAS